MRWGTLGILVALLAGTVSLRAQEPVPAPKAATPETLSAPQAGPAAQGTQGSGTILPGTETQVTPLPQPVERYYPYQHYCGAPANFFFSFDYRLGWMKNTRLPPLVTGGPEGSLGILGQPGTAIILGDNEVDQFEFSGAKFYGGLWLDYDQTMGIEGSYFFFAEKQVDFDTGSPVPALAPVLARPFFNVLTGQQSSNLAVFNVNRPYDPNGPVVQLTRQNLVVNTVDVALATMLQGAEGHYVYNLQCCDNYRIDLLAGVRYLELDEELLIREVGRVTRTFTSPDPENPEEQVSVTLRNERVVTDRFDARSRFYGAQAGLRAEVRQGCWTLKGEGKLALGTTQEQVGLEGFTRLAIGGFIDNQPGGLFVLPTNSGVRDRDVFAVVPELNLTVGYFLKEYCMLYVGYSFLYWSKVIRSPDQINLRVNPTSIPGSVASDFGPAQPELIFHDTSFWAQGISFGIHLRY